MTRRAALAWTSTLLSLALPGMAHASTQGGAEVPEKPTLTAAACVTGELWRCRPGEQLVLAGTGLESVRRVVLLGRKGERDDRSVDPTPFDGDRIAVVLPGDVRPGKVKLVGPAGSVVSKRGLRVLKAKPTPDPEAGATVIAPGEALFAGSRKVAVFPVDLAAPAKVEAHRVDTGATVRSWSLPGGPGEVRWDGTVDGLPVAAGRYAFRVAGQGEARAAQSSTEASVLVHDAVFPIAGKHDLGQTPTNDFGGGGTRNHQGQDMFAKCGTPLVAARPGKVLIAKFQEAAGNYVVVNDAAGRSYVYMHMRDPSLVPTGGTVRAGQRLGYVGLTGRTSGCHLHFEMWTAPGWYQGGKAVDPLPELKRWDAFR